MYRVLVPILPKLICVVERPTNADAFLIAAVDFIIIIEEKKKKKEETCSIIIGEVNVFLMFGST